MSIVKLVQEQSEGESKHRTFMIFTDLPSFTDNNFTEAL
jgi:hypothetical protein